MRTETVFQVKGTRHCLGARTWVMGVLNVTPDSFFDGGRYFDSFRAAEHGLRLAAEGADIIDIGGESSRPGSDPISAEEEIRRVVPVVSSMRAQTRILISVDTTKYETARAALDAGADIINDISSFGMDPRLLTLAAESGAGFILMHMRGVPKTMQASPRYGDVRAEVRAFLAEKLEIAAAYGIAAECLAVDPGIGFGKRLEDNCALIRNLASIAELGRPVVVGVSRKSMIGKILDVPPEERLEGSIAAAIVSLTRGAHILRVHDVQSTCRAVRVADAILAEPADRAIPETREAGHAR
ncbi:MAG: dihydropteroate synthase [Candidatus Aminicenantes bacterium]|nr:dihydropteroate synthase [Candidatus Aminicenantes bacterium]